MFADEKATGPLSGAGVQGRLPRSSCQTLLATLLGVIAFTALARPGPSAAPETGDQPPPPAAPKAPLYETDIEPLLQAKCLRCHGGKTQKAALDLRTHAGILKGGESGPAVVPGKLDKSLLYEKVRDGLMPPTDKNRLSQAQVGLIRRWIEAGAPKTAKLSPAAPPAVTQHEVTPILLRRCTVCHGPRRQEGGLDLRSKASMLRGGKSGPAIVPGKAEESLVIKKIRSGQMPPLRRLIEVSIKPIEPAETEVLAKWIGLGAPEVPVQPDVAGTEPDPLVSDKERDFWAFRPPQPVPVPAVRHPAQLRNPIDAFILQRLEQKGLLISPEADRPALMRRLYLDLTGLPPEPAEVLAFVADRDPRAYEKMVDRLLASPRYGERWGRHWLDVAGYADSEGKREQDQPRLFAYRYRDYVIQSLNADKPYDRFLLEQIAGDELLDYEHAPEITPEMCDNLVATGFLRMAPDPTWYNLTDFVPDRVDVVADEIDVLSAAVMGVTLKCARCHSHKFDPIPQRDYYRLVDILKGAFDEYDWMKSNWHFSLSMGQRSDRDLPYVTTAERRQWEAHTAALQKEISALRADLDRQAAAVAKKYFEERLAQLPEVLRDDVRAALGTPAQKRNTVQAYLAAKFEKSLRPDRQELRKIDAKFNQQAEESERRIGALEAKRLPEPKVRALWDRGEPSPTYLYRRGDYLSPGRLVGPGVPSVLTDGKTPFEVKPPWPGAKKTGRRLALARWLTKPDHPLTARVIVNRLWKHHFGVGLVKTLDNFGKTGARPTHPELLDWLAREFIRQGWSLKAMHRLIVTSAAYRQASLITPDREKLDPDNVLYSRMPLQRLSAEQLYDTMLLVAGRLNETRFGPPDSVEVRPDGLVTPAGTVAGWRRSIYVQQQRKVVVTHLENFDFPQMNPNCIDRRDSTVVPQALHLMNNGMVHQLADRFAHRVEQQAGPDPSKQIEWVYLVALSRLPSAAEKEAGLADLARLTKHWAQHVARAAQPDANEAAQKALATYCHAIMNAAEFLYVD
jgi:hypothetical protein